MRLPIRYGHQHQTAASAVCQTELVLRALAQSRPAQSLLARSRLARLFTRFAAGTIISSACSQLTFVLLFGVLDASVAVSGAGAFVAGAVPNFLIQRFWTWQRSGPVRIRRELIPYLGVITLSGLTAVGITTGVDRLIGGALVDHAVYTTVIAVVYGLSYLPAFVLKFALLDRFVFGGDAARWRRAHNSRDQVPTSTRA